MDKSLEQTVCYLHNMKNAAEEYDKPSQRLVFGTY